MASDPNFKPKKVLRGHAEKPKPLVIEPPKIDFTSGGKGADVYFEASGLESLAKTIMGMSKQIRDAAGFAMSDILFEVIDDAKANYVPVDTGALKDSGNADEYVPRYDTSIIELACWFGAPVSHKMANLGFEQTVDQEGKIKTVKSHKAGVGLQVKRPELYAEDQHENMQYKHPMGGGPKYLEIPFNARVPKMAERIANACGIVLGGVGKDPYFEELETNLRNYSYPGYGKTKK